MFEYENEALKQGKKIIAGVDEVGRGPLAGPVVCCVVVMPLDKDKIIEGINDSKKLSEKKREMLYEKIIETAISYKLSFMSEKVVDEINILQATMLGMKQAIESLDIKPDIVLADYIKAIDTDIPYKTIVKGDSKSYSIACASIVAKVARDRFMVEMAQKYPVYGFEKHKGYGTKFHIEAIKQNGECEIHRQSFIKNFK